MQMIFKILIQVEKLGVEEVCKGKDEVLAAKEQEFAVIIRAKESEISEKDRGFISLLQRCGSLQTQLETVQRRNQSLEVSNFSC